MEGQTLSTKTSTSAQKKTTFLPITAPLFSLTGIPWWTNWLRSRDECGLTFAPGSPVLPCISPAGKFGNIPMSADDGGAWLVELLRRCGSSVDDVAQIGSHSLKITLLSWCAKFGVPREARQILGYHIVKGTESALHYSRDEQAEPLRLMIEMLTSVRDQAFFPDNSRSGYKKARVSGVDDDVDGVPRADEPAAPFAEDLNVSSDGEVGPVEEAADEDEEEPLDDDEWAEASSQAVKPIVAAKAAGSVMYKHVRLMTIHFSHSTDVNKLACGRGKHAGYERNRGSLTFPWPKCTTCFGRASELSARNDAVEAVA